MTTPDAPRPAVSRLRISEDELKDIKPGTALYKRAKDLFDAVEDGADYVQYARDRLHKEGDLEIDDDCVASVGDDYGAYVMVWKWISNDDMREAGYLEEEEEDDDSD